MRHRCSWLDPELIRQLLAEMGLRRLFNQLLLQTGGDVEEAMRWMRMMQQRGYIDPDVDLEAFFAQLTEENVIGRDAEGNVVLAAGGERQIRRDALDEIFGGLQKSMSGYHSVPTAGQGSERLTETRALGTTFERTGSSWWRATTWATAPTPTRRTTYRKAMADCWQRGKVGEC